MGDDLEVWLTVLGTPADVSRFGCGGAALHAVAPPNVGVGLIPILSQFARSRERIDALPRPRVEA